MQKTELINAYYDEKDIMEYYYKCDIKDKVPIYKNITRNDCKGTCSFFRKGNRYYLRDHSQGKTYGVYDIAMHIYNCSFKESVNHVIRDMNIPSNLDPEKISKIAETKPNTYEDIKNESLSKVFRYEERSYNHFDRHYWQQFGITLATLKRHNVRPVQKLEIVRVSNQKFFTIYNYENDYQSICYVTPVNGKVKFYRPNEKERKNKWKSNVDGNCVFGFSTLDLSADVIFIASGLKDLMCLNELGYEGIAPTSEPEPLPKNVIEALKSSGKRIVYLYDTDLAGLKFATKFACLNGFKAVWLPKQKGLNLKDVADFMQHFGKDKTKEIISNMLNRTN